MTGAPDADGVRAEPGRRPRTVLWVAVAVGLVVLGLLGVLATRPSASTRAVNSPLLGQAVPDVAAATIDGDRFSFSDRRGEWVLVNFFATWCVPCRQEHDDLVRFAERHAALGDASVVGVVYDDSVASVLRFLEEEGGSWPMLVDPGGQVAIAFGVSRVPESFLVDPSGVIAAKIVGGVQWERLESLLSRLQSRPSGGA